MAKFVLVIGSTDLTNLKIYMDAYRREITERFRSTGMSLEDAQRMFARLNMSVADAVMVHDAPEETKKTLQEAAADVKDEMKTLLGIVREEPVVAKAEKTIKNFFGLLKGTGKSDGSS